MDETLNNRRQCLFLDYDECLVHSLWASDEREADQLLDIYGEHWEGVKFTSSQNHVYVTFLRNSTRKLLSFMRQLMGVKNMFILSTGTNEYVQTSSEKLGLGFSPDRIFGRKFSQCKKPFSEFQSTHNVLVDNEFYTFHSGGKLLFLNHLPKDQYIQVPPFSVWCPDDDDNYFEWLTDKILEKFNY